MAKTITTTFENLEVNDELAVQWNGSATFNVVTRCAITDDIDTVDCFTVYGKDTQGGACTYEEAKAHAEDYLRGELEWWNYADDLDTNNLSMKYDAWWNDQNPSWIINDNFKLWIGHPEDEKRTSERFHLYGLNEDGDCKVLTITDNWSEVLNALDLPY